MEAFDNKRLIRVYRRLRNKTSTTYQEDIDYINENKDNNKIDEKVSELTESMIKTVKDKMKSSHRKSVFYGRLDGFIKFLVVLITTLVGFFGVVSTISIENGKNNEYYQLSLYAGFSSLFVSAISSFRDSFKLRDRALVLRVCYYDLKRVSRDLMRLQISPKEPIDLLDELDTIESKLDYIDSKLFDYQLTEVPGINDKEEVEDFLNPKSRQNGPPPLTE